MNVINEYLGVLHHFPTPGNKVYIRQATCHKGDIIATHKHEYEHYSILASGSVLLELDGNERELIGPCVVTVKEHKEHKITCITDVAWFCIHGTEETDESKIDEVLISRG